MKTRSAVLATALLAVSAGSAHAQIQRSPILTSGSVSSIRGEVQRRYEEALAATKAREIVYANDVRFTWASEAKVACGIALGYLKTRTIDEDSINKCDDYHRRMTTVTGSIMTAPPVAPPQQAAAPCSVKLPIVFYFEWDVAEPPGEAAGVAAATAQQMQACGWQGLRVAGHADTSGSNSYNQALSQRRANNVAALLTNAGIPASSITSEAFGETRPSVQTPDNIREPLNRRVEVTSASAQ